MNYSLSKNAKGHPLVLENERVIAICPDEEAAIKIIKALRLSQHFESLNKERK